MRPLLPLLLLFPLSLLAQERWQERRAEEIRREKIESILRIRDLRTPHDSRLVRLLTDEDPEIRRQACLAYGSLQDTALLPLLVTALTDQYPGVQSAAAFAIGQTGTLLGGAGRERLEEELLWTWIRETGAAEELLDGIGKWGTEAALRKILLTVGNAHPSPYAKGLQTAIARFAIRGIVLNEGVEYLTRYLRPMEEVRWELVYALQRIGSHPLIEKEIPQLVRLGEHPDPLVRLNIALLLGKVERQEPAISALRKLARFDPDWRVRVNALKGLGSGNHPPDPGKLGVIRECILDRNMNVSVTALGAIRGTKEGKDSSSSEQQQLLELLHIIALNESEAYHWLQQSEATMTLASVDPVQALEYCKRPFSRPLLRAGALRAAGMTGSPAALPLLAEGLAAGTPSIVCGALEGLRSLANARSGDSSTISRIHTLVLGGLESEDVAVASTAAGVLRERPLLSLARSAPLLSRLSRLRVPDDIEAYQEICSTLSLVADRSAAVPSLLEILRSPDPAAGRAAADALSAITGVDYRSRLLSRPEPLHTDLDFGYLRSLPPTVRVRLETARGTILIDLFRDAAPFTVMAILKLSEQRGFYRGGTFHRVVPNFVIQGGDPRGDGWGGPGFTLRSEFSPLRFGTGSVGIASAGKDTEGSQFFITHSPQPHLDGRYTIIGQVIEGQDVADAITVDDRIYDLTLVR